MTPLSSSSNVFLFKKVQAIVLVNMYVAHLSSTEYQQTILKYVHRILPAVDYGTSSSRLGLSVIWPGLFVYVYVYIFYTVPDIYSC